MKQKARVPVFYQNSKIANICSKQWIFLVIFGLTNLSYRFYSNSRRHTISCRNCFVLQGIAEVAGQSDCGDYEMIEVTNPDLLLIKGAREDVLLEACKEFSYLHSLYVCQLVDQQNNIFALPFAVGGTSVLWLRWLDDRKGILPVKGLLQHAKKFTFGEPGLTWSNSRKISS